MKNHSYENGTTATVSSRRQGSEDWSGSTSEMDHGEMMKKAQAAAAPVQEHQWLNHFVGTWKCDVKCWMDPGGPPQQSKGTAKIDWLLGRRFLHEEFQGEMMGKPFQGRMLSGFNKLKRVFQSVWVDEMNTAMFISEGHGDEKQITLEGPGSCPATGRTDIPMKIVLRITSPQEHTLEMFDGSKGNARTMEITYRRQ